MSKVPRPVDVLAERAARTVQITWDDGHVSRYPMEYLRGQCPCAGCQGHGGPHVYHETPGVDVVDMHLVGGYALQLGFSDGHDTGIYTYPFLREICPCEAHGGPGYTPGNI